MINYVRGLFAWRGISCFYVAAAKGESSAVRFYESNGLVREEVAWFVQEC
ncbi:MAG: hypothetical protein V4671_28730 [Armatimonadota bacterium]